MVVADKVNDVTDPSAVNSITDPDAALDDSFRFRLFSTEKAALGRAARNQDRRTGNMARVIIREWLQEHGYLER